MLEIHTSEYETNQADTP